MLDRKAPNSTSSLINGINIIVELIRRYCRYLLCNTSEIETVEMHHHEYTVQTQNTIPTPQYPALEKISILSSDFNDVFHVFSDNLKAFAYSLDKPLSVVRHFADLDWTSEYHSR
jgi:hypothetical protein